MGAVTTEPRSTECPSCGGADVARILYGLVHSDAELNEALRRKKVVLGGCVVTDDDPKWHCNACGAEFGSSRAAAPRP
jgi:hypothetical protein